MIKNRCPQPECRAVLVAHEEGAFNSWVCPNGHGLAATLTELWGHIQDDEIKEIWDLARTGTPNKLQSPGLGSPMVSVTVAIDSDETLGNNGPDSKTLTVAVAPEEEFVWFERGELEQFAPDLPNPELSAEELAKIHEIADTFVNSWAAATKSHEYDGVAGKFRKFDEKVTGTYTGDE